MNFWQLLIFRIQWTRTQNVIIFVICHFSTLIAKMLTKILKSKNRDGMNVHSYLTLNGICIYMTRQTKKKKNEQFSMSDLRKRKEHSHVTHSIVKQRSILKKNLWTIKLKSIIGSASSLMFEFLLPVLNYSGRCTLVVLNREEELLFRP